MPERQRNLFAKFLMISGQLLELKFQIDMLSARRDTLIAARANIQNELAKKIEPTNTTVEDDKEPEPLQ